MNYFVQRILAFFLLIISFPLFFLLWIAVKLEDGGPLIFKQKRKGRGGNFVLYKLRTMVVGAEERKEKVKHLNEADGPVFKIKNDPRYTKVGKFLSKTGLDELPQLINVIKGEMALIGPRPLPVEEANKVPEKYKKRLEVLPGITSLWVVEGAHNLSFKEWMELDLEYIKRRDLFLDLKIAVLTAFLITKSFFDQLKN